MPPDRDVIPTGPGKNQDFADAARPDHSNNGFSGGKHTKCIWSNKTCSNLPGSPGDLQNVVNRDTIRNDDQELHLAGNSFQCGILNQWGRDEEHTDVKLTNRFYSFFNCIENWNTIDILPAFTWGDACYDLSTILSHQLGTCTSFASRDPLDEDPF
jgi:hypothetical protein